MFGISFSEIFLIVVIGLIVIGPQRLPETARFLGHFFSRLQRQVNSVKTDIRREMELEDLKNIQQEYQDAAREVENTMQTHANTVRTQANEIGKETALVTDNKNQISNSAKSDAPTASVTKSESESENISSSPQSVWPNLSGSESDNVDNVSESTTADKSNNNSTDADTSTQESTSATESVTTKSANKS